MKLKNYIFVNWVLLISSSTCFGQQSQPGVSSTGATISAIGLATVTRGTQGQIVEKTSVGGKRITLPTGTIFPFYHETLSEVIGEFQGEAIRVPRSGLTLEKLTPAQIATVINRAIVVTKARYSEPNRQGKNVKTELQKLIAQQIVNPSSGKIEIPITDELILGNRAKPKIALGMATVNSSGGLDLSLLAPQAKILEIEYQWQGFNLKKSVVEGQMLILPY